MNEVEIELLVCISGVSSIDRAGFEFAIKFYEESILPQKLASYHKQGCKECVKCNGFEYLTQAWYDEKRCESYHKEHCATCKDMKLDDMRHGRDYSLTAKSDKGETE